MIKWVGLDEGQKKAKEDYKPMMCVIHNKACPSCYVLRNKFAKNEDIEELSKKFEMVIMEDFDAPKEKEYHPDGNYTPRILFFDPSGKPMDNVVNQPTDHFKYGYNSDENVQYNMELVASQYREKPKKTGFSSWFF